MKGGKRQDMCLQLILVLWMSWKRDTMILTENGMIGSCGYWYTSRLLRFNGRRRNSPRNASRVTRSRLTIKENPWPLLNLRGFIEEIWERKIIVILYWNELMCLAWLFLTNPTTQYVHDYLPVNYFLCTFNLHCFSFHIS